MKANWIESRCFPERRFGGFTRRDGTLAFYTRVQALLRPDSVALDVGCGRGEYVKDEIALRRELRALRPNCARVIGMDPDPAAAANPNIDEFRQLEGDAWPISDASTDLCLADWVLEHVASPDSFFSECARVLKPGGILAARTTNTASPLGLAARLIPNRLHAECLNRIGSGRQAADVFPTYHRCNRRSVILRLLQRNGLCGVVQHHEAEPVYMQRYGWAYLLEYAYLRLAPSRWQYSIFIFARKESRLSERRPTGLGERPQKKNSKPAPNSDAPLRAP